MRKEIDKLEKLGFTNYEARVFIALYEGYRMSAAEIAKEAKIPRPSVYNVLRGFAQKGICNELHTPSKLVYEIIESDVLQDKIENEIRKDLSYRLTLLKTTFKELKPLHRSKKAAEFSSDVELIKGFNRNRELKFRDLIKKSKNAILYMNRFDGSVSGELDTETRKFYKRGGKFKSIYESEGDFRIKINDLWQNVTKHELMKLCRNFEKQGEQIRLTKNVPQIFAVFDGMTVFISLYDENVPKSERSDIIIHNRRFAGFVTEMFELYWDKSDTIESFAKSLISNKTN